MSFSNDLLATVEKSRHGYRVAGRVPAAHPRVREGTVRVTLSRLKARGLALNNRGAWLITVKGRVYLEKLLPSLALFREKRKNARSNMIVAFDIPQTHQRARWLLLARLKALGFRMLQKSVWIGPAPLPAEFVYFLKRVDILRCTRFFKATEHDIV